MANKRFRKIKDYAMVGGIGVMAAMAISGCDNTQREGAQAQNEVVKNGAFVIVEEQSDGSYKVLEEHPSETTRVMVKAKDGSERLLSNEEIDKLIKEEEAKIDNNTSELTNPQGGGLGIGGAILASAAGAILGSYIGNKLFNNQNFQNNQGRNYKSPQAYERSKNSFNSAKSGATTRSTGAKSGFFGGNNANSGAKSSAFGG